MTKEVLVFLGAIVGGIITGIFAWLKSSTKTNADERTQFRDDILKRLNFVENKISHLEEEVTIWKIRYWSLYARTLKRFNISPPDFHKMDLKELETGYKEAIEQLNEGE